MRYTVALRFKTKEYYADLSEEASFGTDKTDKIKIPDSGEHILSLKQIGSSVNAVARSPLNIPEGGITLNRIEILSYAPEAYLYVSRVSGWDKRKVRLPYSGMITCGKSTDNDIILTYPIVSRHHFRMLCENGIVHIEDLNSTNHLYLNGRQITKAVMKSGDVLSIYTFRFHLKDGELSFENMGSALTISADLLKPHIPNLSRPVDKNADAKYLTYHLSPRRREQMPNEEIILSAAPASLTASGGNRSSMAFLLGSGAMMAASLASGALSPAMLLMRVAGMISPIASTIMYSKMNKEEQKQLEEYERLRQKTYTAYISDQKARIKKIADVQRHILESENRSPVDCLETIKKLDRSLWERLPEDSDFLMTRLGVGSIPLCVEVKTRAEAGGYKMSDDDELEELSNRIIEETRYVDDAPVCISFKDFRVIGMCGARDNLQYMLRSILVEISTQHVFRDVRIVGLFDEDWRNRWGIIRWLPHIWDESMQTRFIAFDPVRRHAVCEMLSEVIHNRKEENEGSVYGKETEELPHYIVIAQNRDILYEENIYEDLVLNDPVSGITTLILAEDLYGLPQTCQILVEAETRGRYCVYERDKYDKRIYFNPDEPVHQKQLEDFVRTQAAIELESKSALAAIPANVTFLQGYNVRTVEELNVVKRWADSMPYATLAAPIGVMEGGRLFSLDVQSYDDAHGPHGLLAGTTGSGKSELLQSWILSMAVNYHPHDVNFVIIDYKGGGMSDLMEPLPHVVGKITNIDRNISRSLIAIKSELRRRQKLFAKYKVNNINKYQRAYDEGIAEERLPHLIIVTDEFAELKKEEPEFMTELNSVATIGRSLGIHMLLATQRPAGVVTDQINSNVKFRICMKVQDVADSREMLKRSDAARITQAGRAYIRVGEDEYFGLFQSLYSAAGYSGEKAEEIQTENRVRIVGVTGERIDPIDHEKSKSGEIDELGAVIAYIRSVCEQTGIEKLPAPWLPELKSHISFSDIGVDINRFSSLWGRDNYDLSVPVGMYDRPALQEQGIQLLDIEKCGHIGIFGIPSSGKATLLRSILLSLGIANSPDKVRMTVIDAGILGLKAIEGMPHVNRVITNQDDADLERFVHAMRNELEKRRNKFAEKSVNSLAAYNASADEKLPALIVAVDHVEILFDQSNNLDMEYLMTDIARSGAAYGIHIIFTANSTTGIRYKFLQLVKGTVAMQLPEKGDYMSLVGRLDDVPVPNIPGRAIIKGNPPVLFHAATLEGNEDEKEHKKCLKALIADMQAEWKSRKTLAADATGYESFVMPDSPNVIPVGVETETGSQMNIVLDNPYHLLITSDDAGAYRQSYNKVLQYLRRRGDIEIIEINSESHDLLNELKNEMNRRKGAMRDARKNADFDIEEWKKSLKWICISIDDLPASAEYLTDEEKKLLIRVITKSKDKGVIAVCAGTRNAIADTEEDILIDSVVETATILMVGGSAAKYPFIKNRVDPVMKDIEIEKENAASIDGRDMKIISI